MSAPAPSVYSPAAVKCAEQLGLTMGRANLEVFAATLEELAAADPSVIAVTSDSRGSGKLKPYGERFPEQIVEVGIAEQNLVGIAAGLAAVGRRSFAVSPACFLTARSLEQIKNDICYSNVPATVVGISAGVSYGALGSTHHSLHDFAALRAIHNITIIAPADNHEAAGAVRFAAAHDKPVYLRFGKAKLYDLPREDKSFVPGRATMLRQGNDLALVGIGETVIHCLLAAEMLAAEGVEARVLSMHTLRPLDGQAIADAARGCRAVVTAEEHSVHGGLGGAVAEVMAALGGAPPLKIIGIPDEDTVTGSQADIFRHYGITAEGISAAARTLLARQEVAQ